MPPEAQSVKPKFTGRCYCGAFSLSADIAPLTVAYCHCADCRRVSGAPVSTFAAFEEGTIQITPEPTHSTQVAEGVQRWFCQHCGTHLKASYAYIPGQLYVPIGLLDQAEELRPESHSHAGSKLSWLHLKDDLPRSDGSGRDRLRDAGET